MFFAGVIVSRDTAVEHCPAMAKQVPLTFLGWRCQRCKHEWVPRTPGFAPAVCPKC